MRLHLPLFLRTALLTSMLCISISSADNVVKQDGKIIQITELKDSENGSVEITWDSAQAFLGQTLDGDVTITVSGTGIISLGRGQLGNKDGNIDIDVRNGGHFTLALGDIAYGGGNATINVGSGGTLEYKFGTIAYNNMRGEDIRPVQIVLDGGRLECQSGILAYGTKNRTGAADITVKNHGEFDLSSGLQAGYGFSGGKAVVKLSVEQGGKVTHHGSLGKSDCERDYEKGEGGSYKKDESGNLIPVYSDPGSYDVTIHVAGSNAVYELAGGFIGGKENTKKTGTELENKIHITVEQEGLFRQTGGTLAVGDELQKEISVQTGGVFEQTGGSNNADVTVTGEYKMTGGTVNGVLNVKESGNWLLNGGTINGGLIIGTEGVAEQDNGTISEKASLTVQGQFTMSGGTNASGMTIDGGAFIHGAGRVGQEAQEGQGRQVEVTITSGEYTLKGHAELVNAHVTLTQGTFSAEHGSSLTNVTLGIEGGEASMHNSILQDSTVHVGEGLTFTISGSTAHVSGSTIDLQQGAKLELQDNAELTMEELHLSAENSRVNQESGIFTGNITLDKGTYNQSGGVAKADRVTVRGSHSSYTLGEHGVLTNADGGATQVDVQTGGSFTQEGTLSAEVNVDGRGASYTQQAGLTGNVVVGNGALFTQGGVISGNVTVQSGGQVKQQQDAVSPASVAGTVSVAGESSLFEQGGTINGGVNVTGGASFSQEHDVLGKVTAQNSTYMQKSGQISGGVSVDGSGANFTQKGTISSATPEEIAVVVSGGASFTHEASGTTMGDVELNSADSRYNLAGTITGDVAVKGGTFTQSNGTISQDVSVTGGTYEQQAGKVVGAVVVNGGKFSQSLAEGTVGSIDLQAGTVTQNGTVSGDVSVAKGSYKQDGIVNGNVSVSGGDYTLQSNGTVGGTLTMSGGTVTQQGATTGLVSVEGGEYHATDGASLNGGLQISAGSVNLDGTTISADVNVTGGTVNQQATLTGALNITGGTWKQTAGLHSGSITITGAGAAYDFQGGTISGSLVVDQGASFTLGNGADMSEVMDVTVRDGSTFTIAGTPSKKVTLSLDSANLVAKAAAEMDVTMSGSSSYDMGGQEMDGDILLRGGSLQNASNFGGSLSLETAQATTKLGGMDAQHLSQIVLMGSGSQITELKEGSTLTFRDATNTVLVSSANTGDNARAIVVFDGGNGTVAFGDSGKLVVNFETSLLSDILDEEGNIDVTFLFTNGSFTDEDLSDRIVLGSGLESEKSTGSKTAKDGQVMLHVNTEGVWFASRHPGETNLKEFIDHHKVILDADMHIDTSSGDVTVRQLSAVAKETPTLTVTGNGTHALILENESSIGGVDNGATIVNGNIEVTGADVQKTGGSKMTISGHITGDQELKIQDGILELVGKENSFKTLTFASSGSLMLSGELTLDGKSDWSTATEAITGGGTLVQKGGSLVMGNIALAVNLMAKDGAKITHGAGTITGNITVDGASSTFTQGAGKVVGNVELSNGGSYVAENSGGIEGNVIASGAETTLALGSKVIGNVELSDQATMKGGSSDAQITGHVTLGDGAKITDGTIKIDGTLTLSGSKAEVSAELDVSGDVTLSGNGASFEPTSESKIGGNLILSGRAVTAEYSDALTGGAQVSGERARLTLSTGAKVGEVQLSGIDAELKLEDTAAVGKVLVTGSGAHVDLRGFGGEGTLIELKAGSLTNANNFTGDVKIDTHEGGEVELGNLNAENITQVHVHSTDGVFYTGLADGSKLTFTGTDNMITVGRASVGIGDGAAKSAVFSFNGSGPIGFEEGAQVTLQFESEVYDDFVTGELELWFSNGSFDISGMSEEQILEWAKQHFLLPTGSGFEFSYLSAVQKSDARLTITARNGSKVLTPGGELSPEDLKEASKVVIGTDTTLSSEEGEATVRQLEGKGNLTVENNGSVAMDLKLLNENFVNDGVQVSNGDTVFSGDIDATQGSGIVNIVKEGDASLELRGNVKTNGNIQVTEGTLALLGTAEVNSVQIESDAILDVNDKLILKGETTLNNGTLLSSNHGGEITIERELILGSGLKLENGGPAMNIGESGVLTVDGEDLQLAALSGSGILRAGTKNSEGAVTISGNNINKGDFRGSIDESVKELIISGTNTVQTLSGINAGKTKLNITGDESTLTLAGENHYREICSVGHLEVSGGAKVEVEEAVTLSDSSETTFAVDVNQLPKEAMLHTKAAIVLDNGAGISVQLIGRGLSLKEDLSIVLMQGEQGVTAGEAPVTVSGELSNMDVTLGGLMAVYYENARVSALLENDENADGDNSDAEEQLADALKASPCSVPTPRAVAQSVKILFEADVNTRNAYDNLFTQAANSYNSEAGARMLYDAAYNSTAAELTTMADYMASLITNGQVAAARRAMAAAAGSVIPSLGAAHRDAAKRQIAAATNRACALSRDTVSAESGDVHAWIEVNGGMASLDRCGDEGGYEHRTWGASVGAEMALRKKTAIGLALTASYGDLEADAAEHADGDLDNIYLSFYIHTMSKRLHHDFAMMLGYSDASLNRNVNMGDYTYRTAGNTRGMSFGAAYELAYDVPLGEQKTSLLQPMMGLSVITTTLDAYDESGAGGVGLHVDGQKSTVATLTMGTRFITSLTKMIGTVSTLELRAALAFDMGDDRGEADVSFLGNRGWTDRVHSAELGIFGLQLGAGVHIPMNEKYIFYLDGGAELRNGSSTWGMSAGVRIGF